MEKIEKENGSVCVELNVIGPTNPLLLLDTFIDIVYHLTISESAFYFHNDFS